MDRRRVIEGCPVAAMTLSILGAVFGAAVLFYPFILAVSVGDIGWMLVLGGIPSALLVAACYALPRPGIAAMSLLAGIGCMAILLAHTNWQDYPGLSFLLVGPAVLALTLHALVFLTGSSSQRG